MKLVSNDRGMLRYAYSPPVENGVVTSDRREVLFDPNGRLAGGLDKAAVGCVAFFCTDEGGIMDLFYRVVFRSPGADLVEYQSPVAQLPASGGLYVLFRAACEGQMPEPFLDKLTEDFPELQELLGKFTGV